MLLVEFSNGLLNYGLQNNFTQDIAETNALPTWVFMSICYD